MSDETTEETQSTEESSTSETTTDDKKTDSEVIPASRFKEVYRQMKEAERKLEAHEQPKDDKTAGDKEAQARNYLKGLTKEALAEAKREQAEAEANDYAKFQDEVKEVLDINTDVKKQEFLTFLEKEGDDYSSVEAAMKVFKRLAETAKDASDKARKSIAVKPGLPKSEGMGGEKSKEEIQEADKGKSLHQIAQEAIRESTQKK